MSCNCKSEIKTGDFLSSGKSKTKVKVSSYILKVLAFILMVAALPIINLFIIWFIFRTLVLNRDVDIKPLLFAIGSKFQVKDDEDEEDDEELTEDDVVMEDVEDITNRPNSK